MIHEPVDRAEEVYLTVHDAAARIGRTEAAVRSMIQQGTLPVYRHRGRIYVPESALHGFPTLRRGV